MNQVEIYSEIGNGRNNMGYRPTIVYKGRLRDSIEFVTVKLVDIQRQKELMNAVNLMKSLEHHDNIVDFVDCQAPENNHRLIQYANSQGNVKPPLASSLNISINKGKQPQANHTKLIVEYCPGGTLLELLERDVCLPESIIRIFSSDILSAFLYLHKHRIIYRDLSPRNIFLDECGLVKLGDFFKSDYINKKIDPLSVDLEMMQYLAPELLEEDGVPSFSSDFYSLGCLMYQMATGNPPFCVLQSDTNSPGLFEEKEQLAQMIKTLDPLIDIPGISGEFKDLLKKLLSKNPFERPTWKELVSHPFWLNVLTEERLDDAFKNFPKTLKTLPEQPDFENTKAKFNRSPSSHKIEPKSSEKQLPLRNSLRKSTEQPRMQQEEPEQPEQYEQLTIHDLLLRSSLFQPSSLSTNINIMKDSLPSIDGASLPVSATALQSRNVEEVDTAISKLNSFFMGPDRLNTKGPVLTYLINQSTLPDIAHNLCNSMFLMKLPQYATDTQIPQLSALFLMLFGCLIANTQVLKKAYVKDGKIQLIEKLCSSTNEIVQAKAVACLGELLSFLARNQEAAPISIQQSTIKIIVSGLSSKNELVKHVCVKTVSNVLLSPSLFAEYFDPSLIEKVLSTFDAMNNMSIVDSYSILTALFFVSNKATSLDFPASVAKQLIISSSNDSVICLITGIIIAAATDTLLAVRDPVVDIFNKNTNQTNLVINSQIQNSSLLFEAKVKCFLTLPIIFQNHPLNFVQLSSKFFSFLEKIEFNDTNSVQSIELNTSGSVQSGSMSNSDVYNAVIQWAVEFCESVVDSVVVGGEFDLLQIVYNAIQSKTFAKTIWTTKFEKKIRKIVRNTTFNSSKSEVAIQLIQCALSYNVCDISIISDLCRALNSQLANIRFTVVKLVADSMVLKDMKIIEFVENNVMIQLQALLQDELFIADQTLRILSGATEMKKDLIRLMVKPQVISLIFGRISDNSSALQISIRIVESNLISPDVLINARLVQAILSTMEKREGASPSSARGNSRNSPPRIGSSMSNNSVQIAETTPAAVENALSLLLVTLQMVYKQVNELKSQAKRNLIKSIHSLATLAPKTAILLLNYPKTAGESFCLLVRIFEPTGNQNEVLINSAFHPFSISLSQGCKKPEHTEVLIDVLKTLQWAAENSSAVRLRLKGAGTLMSALKKTVDYGATDELKATAMSCQKVIKG